MNLQIKKLEEKKNKLEKEIEQIQKKIDFLTDKEMKKEFIILKNQVERYNEKYHGDFITELQDVWEKEEE